MTRRDAHAHGSLIARGRVQKLGLVRERSWRTLRSRPPCCSLSADDSSPRGVPAYIAPRHIGHANIRPLRSILRVLFLCVRSSSLSLSNASSSRSRPSSLHSPERALARIVAPLLSRPAPSRGRSRWNGPATASERHVYRSACAFHHHHHVAVGRSFKRRAQVCAR